MKEWSRSERYRMLRDKSEIEDLHEEIAKSSYRQTFHVQPVTGLLNDPNGFITHNGEWHLFYQWFPFGPVHGLKYWYHVMSWDLVTWKNAGVCIRPDMFYDNRGAYSGSAFPTDGKIYLYYTGNHRDDDWTRSSYTCLVKLNDDGTVEKYTEPLFGPNPDYTEHQRDPKVIFDEKLHKYYILIGAQRKDKTGCILVYASYHHNRGWHFQGELKVPGFDNFGSMWECPSIEHIGDQDVLIFCPQHIHIEGRGNQENHNGYLIGEMNWSNLTFTPEGNFHVLDFGFDSYAAECAANLRDPSKAVLVAWMGKPDSIYPVTDEEGWSGCLTLPRELRIRGRRLIQTPLPQLQNLRREKVDPSLMMLPAACEMEVQNDGGSHHLKLLCKENGTGGIDILYDDATHNITIDRSGLTNRFNVSRGEAITRPLEDGLRTLRIYIDHSSVEIFVNDGDAVFTTRAFPTEEEHHFIFNDRSKVTIWKLRPSVNDDFVV